MEMYQGYLVYES